MSHQIYNTESNCGKYGYSGLYYESCNCWQDCSTGTCETKCRTCTYNYKDGQIKVEYLESYTKDHVVITSGHISDTKYKYKYNEVADYLNKQYVINSTIPCYYQKNDATNFKLFKNNVLGFLVTSFLFASFGAVIIKNGNSVYLKYNKIFYLCLYCIHFYHKKFEKN